jgi:Na+-transporting methylmalonyl-CoA/oxaloacetate decarboxylase gamma subunit
LSSQVFGLYLSAIGVTIVFTTLLIIVVVSYTVFRFFHIKASVEPKKELMKVAALAATYTYLEKKIASPSKLVASDVPTNWSAIARIESLSEGVDRTK